MRFINRNKGLKINNKSCVSVVLPTLNIKNQVSDWFQGVYWAKEKIVIDVGSIDGTIKRCRALGAKVLHCKCLDKNFDKARAFGMKQSSQKFVMKFDGDERMPFNLQAEIIDVVKESPLNISGFGIRNRLFFCGKEIKFGHVDRDSFEIRMVRKNKWWYFPFKFHQQIIAIGRVQILENRYLHFNYLSCRAFIVKNNQYTSYDSAIDIELGRRVSFMSIIVRPIGTFLKQFFYRQGFRDRVYGLILAVLFTINNFIYILKIWEKQKK